MSSGVNQLVLESDQEPAILNLKRATKDATPGMDIVLEESPVGDSKSNGTIEGQIALVQASIRTGKSALEERYQMEIKEDHPCIAWLVPHCAANLNRYKVDAEGTTGYRRWKGRNFRREM